MKEWSSDIETIQHEKIEGNGREPDDGIEPVEEELTAVKGLMGNGSFESLRQAIAAGVGKGKCTFREQISGLLSLHGLIICKVLLFIFLLTATIVVTILSVKGSQTKIDEDTISDDILLVKGKTVTVYTSCGPVQGWLEDGGFAFRGIPYALSPEGERRWKLPVPLERLEYCWNNTLITHPAKSSPNSCWQTYRNGSLDGSENCLTVDVFAPRKRRNDPRPPVVVLVSAETLGGGGGKGFSSPQLITPKLAQAAGIVFVRVRFRLGILGFFTATELTKSVHPPHSGNYGLADVRAALRWVNLNAESFGADHKSITVLGHRAGATLVLALASTRKASHLFSRAWLSGPAPAFPPFNESGPIEAEILGDGLVEDLQCSPENLVKDGKMIGTPARCMQNVDAEDLLDAVPEDWKWRPMDLPNEYEDPTLLHSWLTIDGEVLVEPPLDAWARHGLHIPIVIGTTSHGEATPELRRRKDWSEMRTVEEHIQNSVIGGKGLTQEAVNLYSTNSLFQQSANNSHNSTIPPLARLTAMITDIRSICPLINFACTASSYAKNVPVYFYIADSQPQEAGSVGATVENEYEPDQVSSVIGPGADMLEILTYPLHKSEDRQSAIGRMFYTYVWHGPASHNLRKSYAKWDSMEKIGSWPDYKMPKWITIVGLQGRVDPILDYPTCEYWKKSGFIPQYARLD